MERQGRQEGGAAAEKPSAASSSQAPRLRNRETGETPTVIHGNGHTGRFWLSEAYYQLGVLQWLGLDEAALRQACPRYEGPCPPGRLPTLGDREAYRPADETIQLNALHSLHIGTLSAR